MVYIEKADTSADLPIEYIHNYSGLGTKTLFATHYHELVELASFLPRVKNFNVAVAEEGARLSSCIRSCPAVLTGAMASMWLSWPACLSQWCTVPERC